MRREKRILFAAGVIGCVLLFGWMVAHAQVASGNGNSRDANSQSQVNLLSGGNPLPQGGHENSLAKFDSVGGLVDSIVQDTGILVYVPRSLGVRAQDATAVDADSNRVAIFATSSADHAILGRSAEHFGVRGVKPKTRPA